MEVVAEQKMPAVAMTDHGNLFGAVKFYNAANAKGIHPVIGCEVYVSQQGHKTRSDTDRYNHLVLLCENQEGYRNLIDLVSTAYLEGFYYKPRIDKDLLSAKSKGLIALSACLRGDINETLMADRYGEGLKLAHEYRDLFGRESWQWNAGFSFLERFNLPLHLGTSLRESSSNFGGPTARTRGSHAQNAAPPTELSHELSPS